MASSAAGPAIAGSSTSRPSPSIDNIDNSLPQSQAPLAEPTTPHWIVPTEQVAADSDAPLGGSRRAGNVFKGTWNNTVVAVKILSKDTSVDVSLLSAVSFHYVTITSGRHCLTGLNSGRV